MQCECGNEMVPVRGAKNETCARCFREATLGISLRSLEVPKVFHDSRLSDFPKLKVKDRESLFIHGPTGTGKTHFAVALLVNDILNTPANKCPNVDFISMVNLLARIRASYGNKNHKETEEELMGHFCSVESLYLDDIGVEQATDWALARVYQIIDHRWGNQLRTVFTSNFDLDALAEKLDPRISSRIRGMCKQIQLGGKDRR